MTRQVVVTGMGWITPLGQDLDTVWSALISGQSGIKPTTRFDAQPSPPELPVKLRTASILSLIHI